jgi:hypothetical protein
MADLMFPKPVRVKKAKKPLRSRRHTETHHNKEGHEFLYGVQAHAQRRIEVFEKQGGKLHVERDIYGNIESVYTEQPALCGVCENGHAVEFESGHWIHLEKRHCDCLSCTTFGCKPGHAKLHHDRIKFL